MDLKNKKVTVVGLARSGIAACELLLKAGAKLNITDSSSSPKVKDYADRLRAKDGIVSVEVGQHTKKLIEGQDLIVISPGVVLDSPAICWAKEKGIPVIGEMELAFSFCRVPVVAITGTNGKTTVTTLVGEIFRAAGRKCVVCGNIGNPFSAQIDKLTKEHTVILEVSSFQLETIEHFRPYVATVLNITSDHLDRHADFDEYKKVKCRIFTNQTREDWVVINEDDPNVVFLKEKTKAQIVSFSKHKYSDSCFEGFNSNHYAALSISSIFNIPQEVAINTLRNFKGIEHRIEQVAEINGIEFINDSKATNIDSTLWALEAIKKPIVLIAGGRDKGSDFTFAKQRIGRKIKAMILVGETKDKIRLAFSNSVLIKTTDDFSQAVSEAFKIARSGDCVLLSPMCASFDMFTDYKERGEVFKELVGKLVNVSRV